MRVSRHCTQRSLCISLFFSKTAEVFSFLYPSHPHLSLQSGKPNFFSLVFLQITFVLLNLPSMYIPWIGGIPRSFISNPHINPQIYIIVTKLNKCISSPQATRTIFSGSHIAITVSTAIEHNHWQKMWQLSLAFLYTNRQNGMSKQNFEAISSLNLVTGQTRLPLLLFRFSVLFLP